MPPGSTPWGLIFWRLRRHSLDDVADFGLTRHPKAPAPGAPIPAHYDMCMGCGAAHPAGLHMRLIAGEGVTVSGTAKISEMHQGAPGLAHGGVLATVMDELLGSCLWLLHLYSVTAHLEVDYVRPVPVGTTLVLFAEGLKVEGRKFYARGEARLASIDGEVCVRAEGLFVKVRELAEH